MKSIRLSLVVYFLLLLALALGVISALVYRMASRALWAKEESTRALLIGQHAAQCQAERDQLDEHILRRARTLARLAQAQSGRNRFQDLLCLGLLAAPLNPHGQLLMPVWLAEGTDGPVTHHLRWPPIIRIEFADDVISRQDEGHATEYFQIYSELGHPLQHSASLGDKSFTLDPAMRSQLGLFEWHLDDAEVQPGVSVRRVTLKAPVSRFRILQWVPPSERRQPPERRPPAPEPPRPAVARPRETPRATERPVPALFIQCASDINRRDAALEGFQAKLDEDLANLGEETGVTLSTLRQRLGWISLVTFAATVVGGFWLVQLGLSPLRRLSEAVSKVSVKDFRLPLERRRLPRELRPIVGRLTQTLDLLRRAFAREKQAAADISHELRTPVAALLATTELALRKPRNSEEYRQFLADCQGSGKQMAQLVERLLALARLDAGSDVVRLQQVDVAALAEQCVDMLRPLAESRGLSLRVHCPGPASMPADPDKLREVLTNLLHNAIEYNRPEGSIDVSVERQNGLMRLQVHDTGIGITPEVREHLFERFYRGDASRQADGLHAGLGLAIVKGYVELLHGTIDIDSAPGKGSTFRVHLPVKE